MCYTFPRRFSFLFLFFFEHLRFYVFCFPAKIYGLCFFFCFEHPLGLDNVFSVFQNIGMGSRMLVRLSVIWW